jgi:hypothetical protein
MVLFSKSEGLLMPLPFWKIKENKKNASQGSIIEKSRKVILKTT